MSFFTVDGISLQFGGLKAVDSVSFSVEKGEIFTIIGPNGAGKTSIFNLISRLYDPTSGKLFFEGDIVRHALPNQAGPFCVLVNQYAPGSQMGTHRDFDERDLGHPIVSVSIGLPATFVWYGATRRDPPRPVPVMDGDVLVWGGRARAGYHGVRRLRAGADPAALRYNLTFRRAR